MPANAAALWRTGKLRIDPKVVNAGNNNFHVFLLCIYLYEMMDIRETYFDYESWPSGMRTP